MYGCGCALFREELFLKQRLQEDKRRREEARSMLENAAWLERERLAQQEFQRKRELKEKRAREREEREVRNNICFMYAIGTTTFLCFCIVSFPFSV